MTSKPAPENSDTEKGGPQHRTSDELLPPIEPPNAGFILQLFIVPGLIVLAVFLLVMAIGWARSATEDPLAKVQALRQGNQARWQQAFELAQMLVSDGGESPGLKDHVELAKEISTLLEEELVAASTDENSVNLRYYLCRMLGEFRVDEGVGVLLETARSDAERDVRREAINALAVLSHTFNSMVPPQEIRHTKLIETLVELSSDQDELIRSQTAYALGFFAMQHDADARLVLELEKLADDLYGDARYNAAIALARLGNLRAVDAVVEMFDLDAIAISIAKEKTPSLRAFKRDTMLKNALDAAGSLRSKNPHVELLEITEAMERFVERASEWKDPAPVPAVLIERAKELLAGP